MASTISFEVNLEDPTEVITDSDELKDVLGSVAEQLRESISALSPGDEFPDSIQVAEVEGGYAVYTDEFEGWWVEFGTGQRHTANGANRGEMPPFAPFRRGVESMGA